MDALASILVLVIVLVAVGLLAVIVSGDSRDGHPGTSSRRTLGPRP